MWGELVVNFLGFLLPILKLFEKIWQKHGSVPAATAAILVPTAHLAKQVRCIIMQGPCVDPLPECNSFRSIMCFDLLLVQTGIPLWLHFNTLLSLSRRTPIFS